MSAIERMLGRLRFAVCLSAGSFSVSPSTPSNRTRQKAKCGTCWSLSYPEGKNWGCKLLGWWGNDFLAPSLVSRDGRDGSCLAEGLLGVCASVLPSRFILQRSSRRSKAFEPQLELEKATRTKMTALHVCNYHEFCRQKETTIWAFVCKSNSSLPFRR
ncbi:hypothetical protein B0T24DRAFT_119029 [Lasiosphaeria ovina]|uniref:Uncharacterized protein n=1 Tax=Lasiosphaeria ovina TaxID=92902 RepID=A0AAE0MZE5_9PEZI|nr:hypothetical protein B0T24DRAFT_119029 [Lasiosphaeria ovina]